MHGRDGLILLCGGQGGPSAPSRLMADKYELKVRVETAEKLKAVRKGGKCNPYVKLQVGHPPLSIACS